MWKNKDIIEQFKRHPVRNLFISIVLYLIYLFCYFRYSPTHNGLDYLISIGIYVITMCLAVFACLGLMWTYCAKHSKFFKYLSGAAYWIYLSQVPILLTIMPMIVHRVHNFYGQLMVIIFACFLLSILSYEFIVKKTWLKKIVG